MWSVGERGQSGDESTSQTSLQSLAASSVSAKIRPEQKPSEQLVKFCHKSFAVVSS